MWQIHYHIDSYYHIPAVNPNPRSGTLDALNRCKQQITISS